MGKMDWKTRLQGSLVVRFSGFSRCYRTAIEQDLVNQAIFLSFISTEEVITVGILLNFLQRLASVFGKNDLSFLVFDKQGSNLGNLWILTRYTVRFHRVPDKCLDIEEWLYRLGAYVFSKTLLKKKLWIVNSQWWIVKSNSFTIHNPQFIIHNSIDNSLSM